MNSDDLALFAKVARCASISRAAMELGADQSTVSRRVGLLEAELGVRLFHRSGRGVSLTERGQQLLVYANSLADTLAEAERAMRDSAEQGPTRLCIAAQPTIARILFGSLGHAIKGRYPLSQLRFVEGLASHILQQLSEGEVDVAILYLPEHPGPLPFDLLLSEAVHLVAPGDWPLPDDRLPVRELGEIPLILPSTHHGLRVMLEALAARHGFSANIALECDGSISITKRLVAERCGCTLLPPAAILEEVRAGRLRSVPLEPEVRRNVAIVWPKNRAAAAGLWQITQIIRQRVADMVEQGAWPSALLHAAPTPSSQGM